MTTVANVITQTHIQRAENREVQKVGREVV